MIKKFLLILVSVCSTIALQAAPLSDSAQIVQAVEKYILSFYESDPQLFKEAVHTGLAKRTVKDFHGAGDFLKEGTYEEMVLLAAIFDAKDRYNADSRMEVFLLDHYGDTASAKVVAEGWYDYLHLAKVNGRWKIVNILWGLLKKED